VDLGLKGKVALITGGSRGIGKAVAKQLAREGVSVAIAARDPGMLEATAAEITRDTGARAKGYKTDTGDDAAVRQLVAAVAKDFGRVDILVNCAAQPGGQARPPSLAEITNEAFWADMNVKVLGYLRTAREAAPLMARQGGGRIINVSGLAARNTGSTIGTMRNVSVAALTKNLADELAPQGISVVCVHPALTRTEKTAGVIERQSKAQGLSQAEVEKKMGSKNLTGKLIASEEVADVIVFLASPRAVAVNGDSIAAGGGQPGSIHY
jgi:NAD(P)-dependent dehydrogenase (short-subunit alcohol dehydrogenase family)